MLHYTRYTLLLLVVFSTHMLADTIPERKGFFKKLTQGAVRFVESFSEVDTNYVEPQHYYYTVMLQNTNTYEGYRLRNHEGQSVTLAPQPSIKIGPFVGYRWFFLGYTFDLKHYDKNKDRQEIDLSLYSSRLTIDLFYRKTGNLYNIRSLYIDDKSTPNLLRNNHSMDSSRASRASISITFLIIANFLIQLLSANLPCN